MKKLVLSIVLSAFVFTASAQEGSFSIGASVGAVTGDISDFFSYSFSVDAAYMFEMSDQFDLGVTASYLSYIGKDKVLGIAVDIDNGGFLPLAAAARYKASEKFVLGADIGYAIGIAPSDNDGGFYYRPMIGYNLNARTQITASYSGISTDGSTFANFGIGVMFGL